MTGSLLHASFAVGGSSTGIVAYLTVFALAAFVGIEVISKVQSILHTPLMSGTNAIHGIVLLGGLLIVGLAGNDAFNKVILVIAITFGTINIVGGFLVSFFVQGVVGFWGSIFVAFLGACVLIAIVRALAGRPAV